MAIEPEAVAAPQGPRDAGLVGGPRSEHATEVVDGDDEPDERERDDERPRATATERAALRAHERGDEEHPRAGERAERTAEAREATCAARRARLVVERADEIEHAQRRDEDAEEAERHAPAELPVVGHEEEREESAAEHGRAAANPPERVAARDELVFLVRVLAAAGQRLGILLARGLLRRGRGRFLLALVLSPAASPSEGASSFGVPSSSLGGETASAGSFELSSSDGRSFSGVSVSLMGWAQPA